MLQIFLYLNIFVIGVVATIAVQHALAHYRPHKEADAAHKKDDAEDSRPAGRAHKPLTNDPEILPADLKASIIEASQANFQLVLDHNVKELENDLGTTVAKLSKHLDKLGSTVINTEMERYTKQLEKLRHQAEEVIGGAQAGIDKHQAELEAKLEEQRKTLEAKMNEEIAAEKQRMADSLASQKEQLAKQIDAKLGDAVASFLMETLQHNVDLGAQSTYLVAMLDEHKDDFKQELGQP